MGQPTPTATSTSPWSALVRLRRARERPRWWAQLGLLALFYWGYDATRNLRPDTARTALDHARDISASWLDTAGHLTSTVNAWVSRIPALEQFSAYYYVVAHVLVTMGALVVLFVLFFFPGILALTFAGYRYAGESWRYHEVSVYSPADIPIFPLKTLIPLAGATLLVQGLAEVARCVLCLRAGQWPARLHDVEELESAILHEREHAERHSEEHAGGETRA